MCCGRSKDHEGGLGGVKAANTGKLHCAISLNALLELAVCIAVPRRCMAQMSLAAHSRLQALLILSLSSSPAQAIPCIHLLCQTLTSLVGMKGLVMDGSHTLREAKLLSRGDCLARITQPQKQMEAPGYQVGLCIACQGMRVNRWQGANRAAVPVTYKAAHS
jgi:hypothetical protein